MQPPGRPMICLRCRATNEDAATVCAACGEALGRPCPNCGTRNPVAARFCMSCGTSLSEAPRAPVEQNATLVAQGATSPPPHRTAGTRQPRTASHSPSAPVPAESLAEVATEIEERRIVTVLFADITNSTPLADLLDPEE